MLRSHSLGELIVTSRQFSRATLETDSSGDVLLPTGNHGPDLLAACVAALLSFVCLGSGCHCRFLGIQKTNESAETILILMAQR